MIRLAVRLALLAFSAAAIPTLAQSTSPHVTAILNPAAGVYRPGNTIAIGVQFDNGADAAIGKSSDGSLPRLAFHIGSNTRYATLQRGPQGPSGYGANWFYFPYVVTDGDVYWNNITVDSTIDLNGGSLTVNGAAVDPNLNTSEVQAAGGLDVSNVQLAPYFNQPTILPGTVFGTPGNTIPFVYSPATISPMTGPYTVDSSPPGMSITGGSVLHVDWDNRAAPTLPVSGTTTIRSGSSSASVKFVITPEIDTAYLPDGGTEVESVMAPQDGVYQSGNYIVFGVTYGTAVTVLGTPTLSFSIDGQPRTATYQPGPSNQLLEFWYQVRAEDRGIVTLPYGYGGKAVVYGGWGPQHQTWFFKTDTSGIQIGNPVASSSIHVQSAEVWPVSERPFSYQVVASGFDSGTVGYEVRGLPAFLTIDHQTGVISGRATDVGDYSGTIVVSDRTGYATAPITFHVGYGPNFSGGTFDLFYHSDYPDPNPERMDTSNGTTWGPSTVVAADGTLVVPTNTPGTFTYSVTGTNAWGSTTGNITVNVHPAVIQISGTSGTFHSGDTFSLTLKCNEAVQVSGSPTINLKVGDGTFRSATYASGSGTDTLVFSYVIAPTDPAGPIYVPNDATLPSYPNIVMDSAHLYAGTYLPLRNVVIPASIATSSSSGGGTPAAPIITGVSPDASPTFTGTAAPGTEIAITSSDLFMRHFGTTTTGADGTWSLSTAPVTLANGTYTFVAHTTSNGESGGPFPTTSAPVTFTIGVPPPSGPHVTVSRVIPPAPSTQGGNNQWTLQGTAPAGATVSFFLVDGSGALPGTLNPSTTADANGNWSVVLGFETPPGGYVLSASATDAAGDAIRPSGWFEVNVPAAPVVTNAWVTGSVGTATTPASIATYGVVTHFDAPGLADYGLQVDASGVIAGTPTKAADHAAVAVTATNATGTSQPATITLTIAAATTPPPSNNPPSNTPPPSNPPPADNPPPVSSKSNQTITFSSPTSAIIVGQAIQLGATSSAGLPITYSVVSGDATISGNTLTPTSTATLVVRASSSGSDTVNAASVDVNFGTPQKVAQTIAMITAGGTVPAEKPITLTATADSGLPVSYTVVSGPATISGNTLTFTGTGNVTVRASQSGDGTHAAASDVTLTFTANPVNRLVNLSSRVHVSAGDASHGAIAGFAVTGDVPKQILVRAVGPTLAAFGITNGVPAPQLTVFDARSNPIASNAGWNNDAQIATAGSGVGAFGLGANSKDAAVLLTLSPGLYTAQVKSDTDGMVLIEVYDVSANAAVPTKQLINISTRGTVGTGDNALIAGFVVAGNQPKRVLIRGIGPGLTTFGVPGVLADPVLRLYDAHNVVLARNDNWETTAGGDVLPLSTTAADLTAADTASGAFGLAAGSKDAALVVTLPPGQYTAIVSGANDTTGAAIVEVYELP